MLTFTAEQKAIITARQARHIAADELQQRMTGEGGKGCSIFCLLDKYDHRLFETERIGPYWLARLHDGIFEGLEVEAAKKFSVDYLAATPCEIDLDAFMLREKFNLRLLTRLTANTKAGSSLDAINQTISWLTEHIAGRPNENARLEAEAEATAAAAAAAARRRAVAAAAAAADQERLAQATDLIELLREASHA
jgi:hypothetical protein